MRFSDLRKQLVLASEGRAPDGSFSPDVKDFLGKLARFDELESHEVLRMFEALKLPKRINLDAQEAIRDLELKVVAELRTLFDNDMAFRDALERLRLNKAITRDGLNRIYCELFDKERPLASKATREKLVQDIADLRLTRARSKRAAEYFSGKVAS